MGMMLALKAFFKAFKDPEKTKEFLLDEQVEFKCLESGSSNSHLRLLSLLQHSCRLVDFLKEDISSFEDAQVGAAVRKIHEDGSKCLEDLVTIRPVMEGDEGVKITVPKGYDPTHIKLVGNVKGEPPFSGVLVHKGWKAHKRSLPKKTDINLSDVISPAEVEIR